MLLLRIQFYFCTLLNSRIEYENEAKEKNNSIFSSFSWKFSRWVLKQNCHYFNRSNVVYLFFFINIFFSRKDKKINLNLFWLSVNYAHIFSFLFSLFCSLSEVNKLFELILLITTTTIDSRQVILINRISNFLYLFQLFFFRLNRA